jgi:DNA repair exonuclease SbcCD ATPase subunit
MIIFKNITMKNFMSTGAVTQAINLENSDLTLVIGNNLDLGGNGSRNGVGKSTVINALSFVLYGSALTNIKKDNMVNITNNKNMTVTLEFEVNKNLYKIERGRKPAFLKFLVNNVETETDEQQGESRLTQEEIEKLIGMSHTMFKHLVCLNTFTEPFLSMRAADQRDAIEQLLGITQLSEKATVLKELIKNTKDSIKEEEYKNKAIEEANLQIEKSIKDLQRRKKIWNEKKKSDLDDLNSSLQVLNELDVEQEIILHNQLAEYNKKIQEYESNRKNSLEKKKQLTDLENRKEKYTKELEKLENNECFSCGQKIKDENHLGMINDKKGSIEILVENISNIRQEYEIYNSILEENKIPDKKPKPFYQSITDAYEHKNSISYIEKQIEEKMLESDPYDEQINALKKTGIKPVSWEKLNNLTELKTHQDFLLKLLTNKDSFIRKKIIEQNLVYLNNRLEYYLGKLGLPHEVKFKSDLNVEITELGRDLDFDNLSRGERNRLILGLSWSFRDVFESMNHTINFMAVDELIDSGLDGNGVEAALEILKSMCRERNKSIFLISHREELMGRVNNILTVTKENGFTSYSSDQEEN